MAFQGHLARPDWSKDEGATAGLVTGGAAALVDSKNLFLSYYLLILMMLFVNVD